MGVVPADTQTVAKIVRQAEAWMSDFVVSGVWAAAAVEEEVVTVVERAVVEVVVGIAAWRERKALPKDGRSLARWASKTNPS